MNLFRLLLLFLNIFDVLYSTVFVSEAVAQTRPMTMAVPATQIAPTTSQQMIMLTNGQMIPAGNVVSPSSPAATAVSPTTIVDHETLLQARLQQLQTVPLSRTPSEVLAAWAFSMGAKEGSKNPAVTNDLPPAPLAAQIRSDERFALWLADVQRQFLLSDWEGLKQNLSLIPIENRNRFVDRLLDVCSQAVPVDELAQLRAQMQRRGVDERAMEKQYSNFDDVFGILSIATDRPVKPATLASAGRAIQAILNRGNAKGDFINQLKIETEKPEADRVIDKRVAAKILAAANQLDALNDFLPDLTTAKEEKDIEALNLWARYYLAQHAQKTDSELLEKAWDASLAVVSSEGVEEAERQSALSRLVTLASQVRSELGEAWLKQGFSADPQRGAEIINGIGKQVASSLLQAGQDSEKRLELLKLQNQAVGALINANADNASSWKKPLEMLALNWLRESEITYTDDQSQNYRPQMQRDMYGNMFYFDQFQMNQNARMGQMTSPIKTGDLLDARPSETWLAMIDPSLKPKFDMIIAQLFLKIGEEDKAFPYIERLAEPYPEITKALVKEFLEVWIASHDPNSTQNRSNYYMFMYGFESRAESIPLTRSKQQRNLEELTVLVPRLTAMNVGELDQELLVKAFMTCHSFAEVFQEADIEKVFGTFSEINPRALYSLTQSMRNNLASVWRELDTQKTAKTKRNKQDVEAEVKRGYRVAKELVEKAMTQHPEDWSLTLALASLQHDENNYLSESTSRSSFSEERRKALTMFARAAELYCQKAANLEESDWTTEPFEYWYYAAIGSVDLNLVDEKQQLAPLETAKIRDAIQQLPTDKVEWHMNRFANLLFNRLSSVKPAVKSRYLSAGFDIVGDHPQARQAREVHEYYQDLVTEIQLETSVDGSSNVGEQPFGVFVNLVHTKEIEREAGGFGKYLQNQNQNAGFYYNYGRPTEDYREKFEEYARDVMAESFEVLSITFQTPEVKSRAHQNPGWRTTPYAYLLLKAKGPQVDKIPPVKIDFDFLDTSGYAILPVESPALAIDASHLSRRPFQNLALTQILDERQSDNGKLLVEIKATAEGLVPSIDEIFGTIQMDNFEVTQTEDQLVSVSKFAEEGTTNQIVSERSWLVTLQGKQSLAELPREFSFPDPIIEVSDSVHQRYVDADLESVTRVVSLESKYGKVEQNVSAYVLWGLCGVISICLLWMFARILKSSAQQSRRPKSVAGNSPFQVIMALRDVQQSNGFSAKKKAELAHSIERLEAQFFGEPNANRSDDEIDLNTITQRWLSKAR